MPRISTKDIQIEKTCFQLSSIGQFLIRNGTFQIPSYKIHTSKPPKGSIIFAVTKSSKSKNPLSNSVYFCIPPNDKEEMTPIIIHPKVTNLAARPRVKLNSSCRKAVTTSCKEIVEVNAAKASKT